MGNKAKNRFEYQKDGSVKIWLNGKNGSGKYTLVDVDDFEGLELWIHNWCLSKNGYVRTSIKDQDVYLHRHVLKAKDEYLVDHKNGDKLDNRKYMLREVTDQQNNQNRAVKRKNTSSQYKGVSWHKGNQKWQSTIRVDGNLKYLGLFNTEEEAAQTYDLAAKKYFGEYAAFNF